MLWYLGWDLAPERVLLEWDPGDGRHSSTAACLELFGLLSS